MCVLHLFSQLDFFQEFLSSSIAAGTCKRDAIIEMLVITRLVSMQVCRWVLKGLLVLIIIFVRMSKVIEFLLCMQQEKEIESCFRFLFTHAS